MNTAEKKLPRKTVVHRKAHPTKRSATSDAVAAAPQDETSEIVQPDLTLTESVKIKPDKNNVVIRMYNIGFGDCFLLLIPTSGGSKKVLIDCGVHSSGRNPHSSLKQVIENLLRDISDDEDENKKRIDLLIATHRHQDHVSGFADEAWKDVEVGEVWMPWTENYDDPEAVKILKKQSTAGKKLHDALTLMLSKPSFGFTPEKLAQIQLVKDFTENSLSNAKAMDTLHHGFSGGDDIQRRYLPDKDGKFKKIKSDLLPGVTVHILGPSRDEEVIRDMEPGANEQWLRLIGEMGNDLKVLNPFHADWSEAVETTDLSIFAPNPNAAKSLKADFEKINNLGDGAELNLAMQLEKAVNGTSLMLMFQIEHAHLLFPGDAQNGTWKSVLQDEESRSLLFKTNFYKIGHHGSHNATPKEFVFDILQPKFKAMASVYPVAAWQFIPKAELMAALRERDGEVVRSDAALADFPDPEDFTRTAFFVETKVPIRSSGAAGDTDTDE